MRDVSRSFLLCGDNPKDVMDTLPKIGEEFGNHGVQLSELSITQVQRSFFDWLLCRKNRYSVTMRFANLKSEKH